MPEIHLAFDPDTGSWPAATGLRPGQSYTIILESPVTIAYGGVSLRICTDKKVLINGANVTLKAGDVVIFSGAVDDGLLEISDIPASELTVECSHQNQSLKGSLAWIGGEPPYPEQVIALS